MQKVAVWCTPTIFDDQHNKSYTHIYIWKYIEELADCVLLNDTVQSINNQGSIWYKLYTRSGSALKVDAYFVYVCVEWKYL